MPVSRDRSNIVLLITNAYNTLYFVNLGTDPNGHDGRHGGHPSSFPSTKHAYYIKTLFLGHPSSSREL
jgi:hypothetical protein